MRHFLLKTFAVLAVVILAGCSSSSSEVETYTLDNGTTVILQSLDSTPVVSAQVWLHVGAKDEDDATRGLAHIQEHLLFKGTETYPEGQIDRIVEGAGGSMNAATGADRTYYYVTLPSDNVGTAIDILSSMVYEATLTQEDITKELEVVMEEFRRGKDNPGRELFKEAQRTMFREHTYQHPTIGYQDTIENITREQILDFYQRWYVPQNMTVILVGDFEKRAVKPLIAEKFGHAQATENPKGAIPAEPEQTELRSSVIRRPFQNTSGFMAWRLPEGAHPDYPIIDALFTALGQGKSSRLVQTIQEQQKLVTSISASTYPFEDTAIGYVDLAFESENVPSALANTLAEMYRLRTELISPDELEKVKRLLESTFVYQQEEFAGLANVLATFEINFGGVEKKDDYLQTVRNLTAEQIRQAARTYLTNQNLNITIMYPDSESDVITSETIAGLAGQAFQTATAANAATSETAETDRPEPETPPTHQTAGEIREDSYDDETDVRRVVFANGLTLLLREDDSVETFGFYGAFLGGMQAETWEISGISPVMSQLLTRGTSTKDQAEIAQTLEQLAGSITGSYGRNSFALTGKGLSRFQTEMLDLLSELITDSTFPEDQVEIVRTLALDAIKRRQDQPAYVAIDGFARTLFGRHPYGLSPLGSQAAVENLTRDEIVTFAQNLVHPENLVLSIVGDINADQVVEQLAHTLGTWAPEQTFVAPAVATPVFSEEPDILLIPSPKQQANIVVGFPGTMVEAEDRWTVEVMNKVLSGMGGRLFKELRDNRSLAYSVSSYSIPGYRIPGLYFIYMGSDPSKQITATAGIKAELQKLIDQPITAEELAQSQNYLKGKFVINRQSFQSQASSMALDERYGLGYGFYDQYADLVDAVTAEDVQKAAERYFLLENMTISVVGPENE